MIHIGGSSDGTDSIPGVETTTIIVGRIQGIGITTITQSL